MKHTPYNKRTVTFLSSNRRNILNSIENYTQKVFGLERAWGKEWKKEYLFAFCMIIRQLPIYYTSYKNWFILHTSQVTVAKWRIVIGIAEVTIIFRIIARSMK